MAVPHNGYYESICAAPCIFPGFESYDKVAYCWNMFSSGICTIGCQHRQCSYLSVAGSVWGKSGPLQSKDVWLLTWRTQEWKKKCYLDLIVSQINKWNCDGWGSLSNAWETKHVSVPELCLQLWYQWESLAVTSSSPALVGSSWRCCLRHIHTAVFLSSS